MYKVVLPGFSSKGISMNKYDEKAERMRKHLRTHPKDWQTVVSLFKTESKSVDYEKWQRTIEKQKVVAEYRRKADGK